MSDFSQPFEIEEQKINQKPFLFWKIGLEHPVCRNHNKYLFFPTCSGLKFLYQNCKFFGMVLLKGYDNFSDLFLQTFGTRTYTVAFENVCRNSWKCGNSVQCGNMIIYYYSDFTWNKFWKSYDDLKNCKQSMKLYIVSLGIGNICTC